MLDCKLSIFRRQNSFNDKWKARQRAQPVENVPPVFATDLPISIIFKICLSHMLWSTEIVSHELLFAPIIGCINRDYYRLIASLLRTLDKLFRDSRLLIKVQLKPDGTTRSASNVLQAGSCARTSYIKGMGLSSLLYCGKLPIRMK